MSFRLCFFVPGKPQGKGRARATRSGHHYTPAKTVQYENLIAYHGQQAMNGQALFSGPLKLTLTIDFDVPVSWSRKKREQALTGALLPTKKPDLSNVLKAAEDALNQVVYVDDVQIVSGVFEKCYRARAGITVLLESIEGAAA